MVATVGLFMVISTLPPSQMTGVVVTIVTCGVGSTVTVINCGGPSLQPLYFGVTV